MIYIKTFEKFQDKEIKQQPLEVTADMNMFNVAEKDIKDFKSRKNLLEDIYKNYTEDNTPTNGIAVDLYNKLLQAKFIKPSNPKSKITFINGLFGIWAEYCKQLRELQNYQATNTQKQKDLAEKQEMMNSNQGDRQTAQQDITNIQKNIADGNQKINDISSQIQKLKKSTEDELKLKIKNLTLSKQRITGLETSM